MSRNAAETWYRVTQIRERQSQQMLARAQAEMIQARERLAQLENERAAELAEAREQSTGTIAAAALGLISQALAVSRARVDEASRFAEALEQPLAEARSGLAMTARERRIAEKWLERRQLREKRELEAKVSRAADDLATRRLLYG